MQNYSIFGEKPVEIVIEMGLGSCMSEWIPIAKQLATEYGVMIYERAGINKSPKSENIRTPYHIAVELYELLEQVAHQNKIILIAHSQGGLYAQQFCRLYPDFVKGIVLLDPLSARDIEFKEKLTKQEYKKSGVDKSQNFKFMNMLAKLKLGFVTKMILKNAPPLYYKEYSREETKDILNCADLTLHASTALAEYICAHESEHIKGLDQKGDFPDIPLIILTHSSELAIEECIKFGHNTREFAEKIEDMWQEIMLVYLEFSNKSKWIQAKKSTHYIHLQEPDLVLNALKLVKS